MLDVQGFILSKPVGQVLKKMHFCKKKYVIQILKQLVIGHKLGLVHRDVRPHNVIIFNDENIYLIDWNSSTHHGFNGRYEGAFATASTTVLEEYESTRGKEVSAYYADDHVSIIYMILILKCAKDEQAALKQYAHASSADQLIVERREILQKRFPKTIIDHIHEIERERANLVNMDDLYNRCEKIIGECINII
ncbi:unnamed protein product [Adineta steineri]|uniref:Non-specific serine/threonine protein kinase n=2 Tax=Adineta steineri TaxID=433720 RepID=A0A814FB34_9BILA|nr:unnamed protein product [Adineta steineri]